MWLFQGYSIRKIADEFNSNPEYVKKFDTITASSVAVWVREFRRDAERWLDEDALEKYTAEFVRKQHTIDEQIDKLQKTQKLLDQSDPKQLDLFLKFETAIHQMHMNQIKMMSEIELVLAVKKYNKERRLKNETIKMVDSENPEDIIAKKRGYLSVVDSNKKDDKENTQMREMSETLSEEQSSQEMQGD